MDTSTKLNYMSILKSKKTEYEFSLDEIKKLIANDIQVNPDAITVNFNLTDISDYYDRYPIKQVTSVTVTIDETKK